MRYVVTINNTDYEVEVEKGQAGIISTRETSAPAHAATEAAPATAAVESAPPLAEKTTAAAPAAVTGGSGQTIKAPMPGTILDIKVGVGMKVKKGTVLLVLEAMKMENEIVAPDEGTVTQIITTKGSNVNAGDPLVVI